MTTEFVKSQIRRGPINQMPILDEGEMGLAIDENRVFVGTQPNTGTYISTETIDGVEYAVVEFTQAYDGVIQHIDIDTVYSYTFRIEVDGNLINDSDIIPSDHQVKINIGSTPTGSEVYVLKQNVEITATQTGENPTEAVRTISFQKSTPAGTVEPTGISFNPLAKNSITLNYFISSANVKRKGTLDILVHNADSAITDTFTEIGTSDIAFSLIINGSNFDLSFDTTDTDNFQFNYTQTSIKL